MDRRRATLLRGGFHGGRADPRKISLARHLRRDLAPFYEIAERTMEITADPSDVPNLPAGYCDYQHQMPDDWQSVRRAALKRGQGFTTMPLADGPPFLFLRRGTSFNSYSKLLARLPGDPAFKLITRAHALRLEWDGQKEEGRSRNLLRQADHGAQSRERQRICRRMRTPQFTEAAASIRRAATIRTGWATAPGLLGKISS